MNPRAWFIGVVVAAGLFLSVYMMTAPFGGA